MDVSSSLAPGPSLLVWVKRESNRTLRGLNGQSLENSLQQVRHTTYLSETSGLAACFLSIEEIETLYFSSGPEFAALT